MRNYKPIKLIVCIAWGECFLLVFQSECIKGCVRKCAPDCAGVYRGLAQALRPGHKYNDCIHHGFVTRAALRRPRGPGPLFAATRACGARGRRAGPRSAGLRAACNVVDNRAAPPGGRCCGDRLFRPVPHGECSVSRPYCFSNKP